MNQTQNATRALLPTPIATAVDDVLAAASPLINRGDLCSGATYRALYHLRAAVTANNTHTVEEAARSAARLSTTQRPVRSHPDLGRAIIALRDAIAQADREQGERAALRAERDRLEARLAEIRTLLGE